MKKIIVTGAAGFIGARVAAKLLESGAEIAAIDNLNDYYNPLRKLENISKFKKNKNFSFIKGHTS